MNVREGPDGASDPVTDIAKNDIVSVMSEDGDWFRISLRGRENVWIKNKNSKKILVEKIDAAVGGPIWEKQEIIARGEADPDGEKLKAAEQEKARMAEEAFAMKQEAKAKAEEDAKWAPTENFVVSVQEPLPGGVFWVSVSLAAIKVRKLPDPDADMVLTEGGVVGEVQNGDFFYVLEAQEHWCRIQNLWCGGNAWIMHTNQKGKVIGKVAKDPVAAKAAWTQAMVLLANGGVDPAIAAAKKAEESKMKADAEAVAAAKEARKLKSQANKAAKEASMQNFKHKVQPPLPDGAFWMISAASGVKVRDEPDANAEVVGEVDKGEFCYVLVQEGDWCSVQNIWDGKPEAWFMVVNQKTRKMLAEVAKDPADARTKWTAKYETLVSGVVIQPEDVFDKGIGGLSEPPPPPPKPAAPPPSAAAPVAPPLKTAGPRPPTPPPADPNDRVVQEPSAGGAFWLALAPIKVRTEANASGDEIGSLSKGDFVHVLSQDGDWCKVQNVWDPSVTSYTRSKVDAWLMFQNKKGKQMAEPSTDADAVSKWRKLQEDIINPPKLEEEPVGGGSAGSGEPSPAAAVAPPPEAAKPPPPAAKPPLAAAAPPPAATAAPPPAQEAEGGPKTVQPRAPGGVFWTALAAIKVRTESNPGGDEIGSVKKGETLNVVKTDGDWCLVQNIWDNKPEAWFMFQNKKGKQMGEPSTDAADAQAKFTRMQEELINPPAAPVEEGGSFGKKAEKSDEELELLKMLKGFSAEPDAAAPPAAAASMPAAALAAPAAMAAAAATPTAAAAGPSAFPPAAAAGPPRVVQPPMPGGTWWIASAVMKVRAAAAPDGDDVGTLKKGDSLNVLKTEGDWHQIQNYWGDQPEAWVMFQAKGKPKAELAADAAAAATAFIKRQESDIAAAAAQYAAEAEMAAASKGGGMGGSGGGGMGGGVGGGAPPPPPPPARKLQQPLPGGTWWTSNGVVKVLSKADKKGDPVGVLKKGNAYNVLKTDGDWQQIQNYWDEVHEGWIEFQVKGKPKCELAADPTAAAAAFTKRQEDDIAAVQAQYEAETAAAAEAGGGSGGGPKTAAEEEAELLAMLKGGGGGGGGSGAAAGSLEERLDDSDVKIRSGAFEELAKLFEAEPDGASAVFASKLALMPEVAKEKNAAAFVGAIKPCSIFMERAHGAGSIAVPVAEAMIKNGFKNGKVTRETFPCLAISP